MAWKQPGDKGHNRDPWGRNNNSKNPDSNKNKGIFEKESSSLDNIFRKLRHNLIKFPNKGKRSGLLSGGGSYYIGLAIAVAIAVWISHGFYTIKEAERGVVLRFGKFDRLVQPGLNWRAIFVDSVTIINVESVRELAASGIMLTSDENVVRVEMNVQYRVIYPENYLFSVTNADESLQQATDSALRGVIGKYTMDRILTEGRTLVRSDTQRVLEETIQPYNMGITLLDVNFQVARPPEEVKEAFDDAIAAQENEQQYIREAEAYSNEVQPRANGQAERILEEGRAYKARTILKAQGEVQRFSKILPVYKAAPKITRERMYIDMMEEVLTNTKKILIHEKDNKNLLVLPLDQILHNNQKIRKNARHTTVGNRLNLQQIPAVATIRNSGSTIEKWRVNTQRANTVRGGRE